ncbi:MAG: IspD/TarI family cytidylyltransferase [Thermoguttaceae bacterium]|nr:IspD/TarI family cytidylyltransferase [Thermoguttaceae bacterium]
MRKESNFAVILPAAGRSRRFLSPVNVATSDTVSWTDLKKVYTFLLDRPVWSFATELFAKREDVAKILLVIAPEDQECLRQQLARLVADGHTALRRVELVHGGAERSDSIRNAIGRLLETDTDSGIGWIAVHDAARPCITAGEIDRIFMTARQCRAVIPAIPVAATLKRERMIFDSDEIGKEENGQIFKSSPMNEKISMNEKKQMNETTWIGETVSRKGLWEAQTPQVFEKSILVEAYRQAEWDTDHSTAVLPTDDAQLVERLGVPVAMVRCSSMNLKITTQEDLRLAEAILRSRLPTDPS